MVCLLVFSFLLLIASAYRQYQTSAAAARLSDAACTISTKLAVEELAYRDAGGAHPQVLDLSRAYGVENFRREIGGEFYGFNFTISYLHGEEEVIGPFGLEQPDKGMTSALELAVTVYENGRYLPAKLGVVVWR